MNDPSELEMNAMTTFISQGAETQLVTITGVWKLLDSGPAPLARLADTLGTAQFPGQLCVDLRTVSVSGEYKDCRIEPEEARTVAAALAWKKSAAILYPGMRYIHEQ